MTDAQLWSAWQLWLGVAVVVVVIAASLLITIWLTARKILFDAGRALAAGEAIRKQTQAIWALETTNTVAQDILANVQAIEEKANALGQAVGRKEPVR